MCVCVCVYVYVRAMKQRHWSPVYIISRTSCSAMARGISRVVNCVGRGVNGTLSGFSVTISIISYTHTHNIRKAKTGGQ